MSERGHHRQRIVSTERQPNYRPIKGIYQRDRCPTCEGQICCRKLSAARAWCNRCQKGFARG